MLEENNAEKKYSFKSLLYVILIKCKIGQLDGLTSDVNDILRHMDKVSKNDANDALDSILETLIELKEQDKAQGAMDKILDYLKSKNLEQLWLNASIKLCKIYYDKKDWNRFQAFCEAIKSNCRLPDGSDDPKKSSSLLEVYSLEINLHMQTMNMPRIKEIYYKTKSISITVADPRTMGVIRDTHGKMLMIEKDWEEARKELFEAFKSYQEVGSNRAKQMLKYVVIVSILANSSLNPFDNVEAKVYKEDPDISVLDNLRTAYEKKSGRDLVRIISTQKHKIFDESFIQQFQEDLMTIICLEMVVAFTAPFSRMKFDYLARELNLTDNQVASYLSRLVLDGRLNGRINLIENYFENFDAKKDERDNQKMDNLHKWIRALSTVSQH